MTPEEYQRIKEAEKEHLRALKALKNQLREVERKKSVAQALKNMTDAPGADIERTHEEMIERLAMDTIEQEVRLEMALSETETPAEETDSIETEQAPAVSDAELQRIRAQELVRQIKVQMGMPEARRKPSAEPPRSAEESAPGEIESEDFEDDRPMPEKTIGRIPKKKR